MRAWYLGHPDTKAVVGMVVAKNFTELCEVVGEMADPIFFLYLEAYRSAAIVSPGLLKCNVTEWCFGPDLDVHRNDEGHLIWSTLEDVRKGVNRHFEWLRNNEGE